MRLGRILAALAFALVTLWARPLWAQGTVGQISVGLMCYCGCIMVLSTCQCSTADQMRGIIQAKLDDGQPPDQIIQHFVDQYGEEILAAPSKRGFNLTAWVLPFVAIAMGAGLIYYLLQGWVRKGEVRQGVDLAERAIEDEYEERFERELERFE